MQCNTLQQMFARNAAAKNNLTQKERVTHIVMLTLAIVGVVFSLIGIIAVVMQGWAIFCVMVTIAMILWLITIIRAGAWNTVKAQIVQIDRVQRELQNFRQSDAQRKEYLQNVIQKCNDVVTNANQYLTYQPDAVSNLLFAMMCHDIGTDRAMDQKLFQIRQHVFQKVD